MKLIKSKFEKISTNYVILECAFCKTVNKVHINMFLSESFSPFCNEICEKKSWIILKRYCVTGEE